MIQSQPAAEYDHCLHKWKIYPFVYHMVSVVKVNDLLV